MYNISAKLSSGTYTYLTMYDTSRSISGSIANGVLTVDSIDVTTYMDNYAIIGDLLGVCRNFGVDSVEIRIDFDLIADYAAMDYIDSHYMYDDKWVGNDFIVVINVYDNLEENYGC